MNRRQFLSAGSALVGAAALAACATTLNPHPGPITPASVAQDVTLISSAFAAVVPQLSAVPGVTPAVTQAVNNAVADLQAVAGAIATADTAAAAKPLVVRVEANVNAVVAVLAGLPLPAPISSVLHAASILLPIIETAVGIIVPAGAASNDNVVDARKVLRRAAVS